MKTFNRTRKEFTSGQGSHFDRVMPDFIGLGGLLAKSCRGMIPCMIFSLLLLGSNRASAAPPVWVSDFGDELEDLTNEDDEQTDVTLSFPFPFEGTNYTMVYVGTNGGLQLGGDGDDNDIDYDVWGDLEEFYEDGGEPTIFPFETDLDLSTTGTIHFRDFGDRAVFTWNEVGTDAEEEHLATFQV
ncbi:MAG: hypothetical protein P1U87_11585 [Verrucomicrobiales bacterium]|nr:hypothetical protein [Verrucomicrobiales bacterium]